MVFLRTEEEVRAIQNVPPGWWAAFMDSALLGPTPHTVGNVQPASMTCTTNKSFHRFNYQYKKGTKAQYLAKTTDEGKVWAKIRVEGMTKTMREHSYDWVEKENVDVDVKEP